MFSYFHIDFFSSPASIKMFVKPKQNFEISFQRDISEQLSKMSKHQLIRIFFAIFNILHLNTQLLSEYKQEFTSFFRTLGSVLAEDIKDKIEGNKAPNMEQMAQTSSKDSLDNQNPYISSFIYGIGGPHLNRSLAGNIVEALFKLVDTEYDSYVGWRDSLVTYVKSHSKATISALTYLGSHPTYRQIVHFINTLKPSFNPIRDNEDVIVAFDNEQKLKKSYRIGGEEGSNKMTSSLCTMVLNFYPNIKNNIQYNTIFSPANWLWNMLPKMNNLKDNHKFSETLQTHKESWWNKIIKECFEESHDKTHDSESKKIKLSNKVKNRRNLYDFAESKHQDNPAEIEVGKPLDLNPSSYDDVKKIVREQSKNVGIEKYESGSRSWFALVCDGSPFKLLLSLFNVLFFCKVCKCPCGELKKHMNEAHNGSTELDIIQMEFDHVLPLCGPGHVEKNLLGATLSVLWDLIGFDKIASVCNFKSRAQHEFLKKVKDHHISADFLIICLQTFAKEIIYEFSVEWKKTSDKVPTYSDLLSFYSPGKNWIRNVNLARIFSHVNGPLLSMFMLRTGVRCSNGPLYYGAIQDCLSVLYHNKNNNYIKMLHFELYLVNKAPKQVQSFIFKNLFQRNKNHNNQNTSQGVDYKLEEYNKLFKQFEASASPSIDDWIRIASVADKFKEILESQSSDYNLDYGLYSEPGAPDYSMRIECCLKMLRESEALKSSSTQSLKNVDGKKLNKDKTFNYEKKYKDNKRKYLESVIKNKSFIKAELDFVATDFLI